MINRAFSKILAGILASAMILTTIPLPAAAEEPVSAEESAQLQEDPEGSFPVEPDEEDTEDLAEKELIPEEELITEEELTAEEELITEEESTAAVSEEKLSSEASDEIVTTETSEETIDLSGMDLPDNDELLAMYLDKLVDGQIAENREDYAGEEGRITEPALMAKRSASLSGLSSYIYGQLITEINKVAAGERASTEFVLSAISLTNYYPSDHSDGFYSAEELGLESLTDSSGKVVQGVLDAYLGKMGYSLLKLNRTLLYDHPYEMYWYDKTTGVGARYSYSQGTKTEGGVQKIRISSLTPTIYFYVAKEYSSTNAEGTKTTNTTLTSAAKNAVTNAQAIVNEFVYETDYERLSQYRYRICHLSAYNEEAWQHGATMSYGNPWQLIWVFDNDPDTKVVCEGYSKAFKLLCDLTPSFAEHGIECYTVTGAMGGGTGAGGHMWNMVKMEDGNMYVVDITNSDTGSVGDNGSLFLAGTTQKASFTRNGESSSGISFDGGTEHPLSEGYRITTRNSIQIQYAYDGASLSSYTDAERTPAAVAYTPENAKTLTFDPNGEGAAVVPLNKTVLQGGKYGELPVPTRSDFVFDGWYTLASGGSQVTSTTSVASDAGDHALYAHWVPVKFNGSTEKKAWYPGNVSVSADGYTVSSTVNGTYTSSGSIVGSGQTVGKTFYFRKNASDTPVSLRLTVSIDKGSPTATTALDHKSWSGLQTSVAFGSYRVNDNSVSVEPSDPLSGPASAEYVIVTGDTQYTSAEALEEAITSSGSLSWAVYDADNKPRIAADTRSVLYVKVTDRAGNTGYASTGGIFIDTVAPVLSDTAVVEEDTGAKSVKVQYKVNDNATVYFVIVPASDTTEYGNASILRTVDPSAAASYGGTAIETAKATKRVSIYSAQKGKLQTVTLSDDRLSGSTPYKVWITSSDSLTDISVNPPVSAGNMGNTATLSFTTAMEDITGSVTISPSAPSYGSLLTATPRITSEGDGAVTYAWFRKENSGVESETAISGATSASYTVAAEDVGKVLLVKVYKEGTGKYLSAQTPKVAKAACPSDWAAQGGTVYDEREYDKFTFSGKSGVIYEYSKDGGSSWTELPGGTYTVPVGNVNVPVGMIRVRSKATAIYLEGTQIRNEQPFTAVLVGTVSVNGTASPGSELTASAAGVQSGAVVTYSWYQVKGTGTPVSLGTGDKITVPVSAAGSQIYAEATAEGYTGKLTSNRTGTVPKAAAEGQNGSAFVPVRVETTMRYDLSKLLPVNADAALLSGTVYTAQIASDTNGILKPLSAASVEGSILTFTSVKEKTTASGLKATVTVNFTNDYYTISAATLTIETSAPEEVFIELPDGREYEYTGSAIKPAIRAVYAGEDLIPGVDYTVSYKNNKKVKKPASFVTVASSDPQVVVTFKGAFSGTQKVNFEIKAIDLAAAKEEGRLVAEPVSALVKRSKGVYTVQKLKPVIYLNGTKLKAGTDYTLDYTKAEPVAGSTSFASPGTWAITVVPKGANYLASSTFTVDEILKENTEEEEYWSLSSKKVKVTLSASSIDFNEDRDELEMSLPEPTVYYDDEELSPHDYICTYLNADRVGTATIVITAAPDSEEYVGKTTKTFKIKAIDLSKKKPTVTVGNAGRATYEKGGVKPEISVTSPNGYPMVQGVDYKVTYGRNTTVKDASASKPPYVKITGMGHYKNSVTQYFSIVQGDISKLEPPLVSDVAYSKTKNAYKKTKIILKDANGKALKQGTDFTVTYSDPGTTKPEAGTVITIRIDGKKNYTGSIADLTYRVLPGNIGKSKLTFYQDEAKTTKASSFEYTGREIEPSFVKLTIGSGKNKVVLTEGTDFEIAGYYNNIEKGNGYIVIRGIGENYTGVKTFKFKIKARKLKLKIFS